MRHNHESDDITKQGDQSGYQEVISADGSWGNTVITFSRIQGIDVAGVIHASNLLLNR